MLLAITLLSMQTAQVPAAENPPPDPDTVTVIESRADGPAVPSINSPNAQHAAVDFAPGPVAAMYLREWANCIVLMRRATALTLLAAPLNSPEQARIVNDLTGHRFTRRTVCARFRRMRVDNLVLRGAIAESLYRWEERRRRSAGPLPAPAPGPPAAGRAAQLAQMGTCVVERDPSAARRVMATRPGTRASRQTIAELTSRIDSCLPTGLRASDFHPLLLRGALGEPFYRLRRNAGGDPST